MGMYQKSEPKKMSHVEWSRSMLFFNKLPAFDSAKTDSITDF